MDVEGDDEDDNNVISSVLKTGSSILEEIMKETREVFKADDNTPTSAEANPIPEAGEAAQTGDETDLPTKGANQA